MKNDRITIITVCRNAETVIEATMRSVLDQTYQGIEYIIVDGASTDGTMDVVRSVAAEYPKREIIIRSEPDAGIYDAMNKGIKMATGKWINFMNAGDIFYTNDLLSSFVPKMNSDATMVFGDMVVELDGEDYIRKSEPFYEHLPLHHSMGFCHQSSFVKTEYAKHQPFNLHFKLAADYDMVIGIFRKYGIFQYVPEPIAKYEMGGVSYRRIKYHIRETFEIDNHRRTMRNKISVEMEYLRIRLREFLKKILSSVWPDVVRIKRRRDTNLIRLNR